MRSIKKGSTDQSVVVRILATDGTPKTDVAYNSSGIDLWYRREGAVKTSITEATLSALDDAHSDGGVLHIGDGYYRLDLPDAAVASGSNGVMVGGAVTGGVIIGTDVPLVDYDPQDAVRLGLTALPNAAADAAGGLPISDAGGLDLDAQIGTKINDILTDTGTTLDGKINTIDGIVDDILLDTAVIGAAGAGLTAVPWNASWDAEVQSECADALTAYDPPTHAELTSGLASADDATLAAIAALNNLSAAQVNAEVDTAIADVGLTTTITGRIDAAITTRAATGAAMTLADGAIATAKIADGAITDAKFTVPTVSGVATGILGMIAQLWRLFVGGKSERDSNTGTIKTFADDNTTVLTTQTYTNSGGVETRGKAT